MSISEQCRIFVSAPHRVMFFGGALQTLAAMLWWLSEIATRYGVIGHPADWPIIPVAAHGYLMIYMLFPFFMFGFLMTVFPRWMGGREIPARRYVPAFVLLMLGAAGFYAGLFTGQSVLLVSAFSTLAGWYVALNALLRVLIDTSHPDKRHPKIIFLALCIGWCCLAAYFVWLLSGGTIWLRLAIQGGIWLFLLPVFASVAHRMIPFFTSVALQNQLIPRPFWPWWTILAASAVHGVLQIADISAWLWLCDAPMAVSALYLTHVWGMRRSLGNVMLGVLHIGFAWLGIAMLLFTVQSLVLLIGASPVWGLAPLHALTVGYFATLLIGMSTRVTLGHSGMPVQADIATRLMFAGMQLAAILRVLADMLPAQIMVAMYLAAAAVWLLCYTPWVLRYLPFCLRAHAG